MNQYPRIVEESECRSSYVKNGQAYVLRRMGREAAHPEIRCTHSSGDDMRRLFPALFSVLLLAPHVLVAQDATQAWLLTPGARVRVTYAGEDARVGTLVSLVEDTLAVRWVNGTETARMARARVTRFAVSRGVRPSNRGTRAKIGMIVGAGSVLLIAKASGAADSGGGLGDLADGIAVGLGAVLVGGVGALIGAATGGPSEEWEDVSLTRPHVGLVVPTPNHGAGTDLALMF